MTVLIGFGLVISLVFGGFVLSGGKFGVLIHAVPFEGMMIVGAAVGSFVIANSFGLIRRSGKSVMRVFKGTKWKEKDYNDILALMFELTRLYRVKGILALDDHVEKPEDSDIFQKYPKLMKDHFVIELITDSFRMLAMQFDDQYQTEDVINRKLKKHHHEALAPANSIQTVADALPAIGIVVAVLGVIKTMGAINEKPEILGEMIGGALAGTMLGVFLAYCLVAPIAARLRQIEEEDASLYSVIRDIFVAMVAGHPPNICIEIGRGNIPTAMQPNFYEVEEAQKALQAA
ncbi:flagellar motor stator protein MotA [Solirhodobacter olei]|uniref:flagellar motor stator protein MotA n=1 Tax=Solirhodobacter olei TaxID=2493082 RepID=UPI000FD792F2|nr:flagellar motor stator protein MotA [Solirhodobacter olei]